MNAAMFLTMKYNKMLLTLEEACSEIGMAKGTAHNKIGNGTFPLPSRIAGKNRIVDVRDLGEYIDREREQALQTFNL